MARRRWAASRSVRPVLQARMPTLGEPPRAPLAQPVMPAMTSPALPLCVAMARTQHLVMGVVASVLQASSALVTPPLASNARPVLSALHLPLLSAVVKGSMLAMATARARPALWAHGAPLTAGAASPAMPATSAATQCADRWRAPRVTTLSTELTRRVSPAPLAPTAPSPRTLPSPVLQEHFLVTGNKIAHSAQKGPSA